MLAGGDVGGPLTVGKTPRFCRAVASSNRSECDLDRAVMLEFRPGWQAKFPLHMTRDGSRGLVTGQGVQVTNPTYGTKIEHTVFC